MRGTVETFDPERRFGFILGEHGGRYFVHVSDVAGPSLEPGERVEFEPTRTIKGYRALAVRRPDEAAP